MTIAIWNETTPNHISNMGVKLKVKRPEVEKDSPRDQGYLSRYPKTIFEQLTTTKFICIGFGIKNWTSKTSNSSIAPSVVTRQKTALKMGFMLPRRKNFKL